MNLKKMERGQRINLSKENPGLSRVRIGLSWDVKEGVTADLDASVACLGENEKLVGDVLEGAGVPAGLVFYSNTTYKGVTHQGDNRTGEGEGDDETVIVDLNACDGISEILTVITIYNESDADKVVFGRVKNASVRLYDDSTGEALYEFDLTEDASNGTAVEMARLYKKDGQWRFGTLGEVVGDAPNGLEAIAQKYMA